MASWKAIAIEAKTYGRPGKKKWKNRKPVRKGLRAKKGKPDD